jgi:hypothetical protein
MEPSRPFDANVLALGRRLVESLREDDRDDPLSAWMAHHVARLMIAAESAPSSREREVAEARCIDTILMLWDHRGTLPGNSQPLAKVQESLDFLVRLNPHSKENLFFRMRPNTPPDARQNDWLLRAEAINDAARMLIRHFCEQAFAGDAAELKAWVELAPQLDRDVLHSDVALAAALAGLIEQQRTEMQESVEERLIKSIDVMLKELQTLRGELSAASGDTAGA